MCGVFCNLQTNSSHAKKHQCIFTWIHMSNGSTIAWSRSTLANWSTCSKFKFMSICELFEFPVLSWSSFLFTFLMWRSIFLFAPKVFLHSVQETFSWFLRCSTSKRLLRNDFGLFLQVPATQPLTGFVYPSFVICKISFVDSRILALFTREHLFLQIDTM